MRIAYQGAPGAFGELAALEIGGEPVPYREFGEVLDALLGAEVDRAVLPVENSRIGTIVPVRQLLAERVAQVARLETVGEVTVPVHHCLILPVGAPAAPLARVFSHPAALAQCRQFFARRPELEPVAVFDTAGALDEAAGLPGVAVLASERAALLRGATLLERNVEDDPANATRFVVLARR